MILTYCTLSNGSACHASRGLLPDRNMWFGHASRRLVPKTNFVSRQIFGPDGLKFGWRRFAAQKCPDVSRRTWKGLAARAKFTSADNAGRSVLCQKTTEKDVKTD